MSAGRCVVAFSLRGQGKGERGLGRETLGFVKQGVFVCEGGGATARPRRNHVEEVVRSSKIGGRDRDDGQGQQQE